MTSHPVLFVDHAPALGGAERSLLLLLEHVDRERWQLHVAGVQGPLLKEAKLLGVKTHTTRLPRLRRSARFPLDWMQGVRDLVHVVRRTATVLVVANTVRAAIFTAPAARLSGVPFIWHMRDFWLSESRPNHESVDRLGKRLLTAAADIVITNSAAVAGHLPMTSKINVVYNGIDIDAFRLGIDGEDFRNTHQIPLGAPLVGMIGRMRPWKGQLRFLEIARHVRNAAPQARFVLVGGDPFGVADNYAASVAERVEQLGLREVVAFTGHLEDVRPALAAMDLFVHPGEPEPFGLVNVEAMAMARPVVAFAHGALPEIVSDGVTGRLVAPGDRQAMVQAVLDLLNDPPLRSAMGEAARKRAGAKFSIQRVTAEMDAIFTGVVRESS